MVLRGDVIVPRVPKINGGDIRAKKKYHTRKNTIVSGEKKRILLVCPSKNGRIHDKRQLDKEFLPKKIPPEVAIWLDKGYDGIKKEYPKNKIMIPKKKPKNGQLTVAEKQENKIISSLRMPVEHAIGGLKRFASLTNTYRNNKGQDDKFVITAAGLWNFHLNYSS